MVIVHATKQDQRIVVWGWFSAWVQQTRTKNHSPESKLFLLRLKFLDFLHG